MSIIYNKNLRVVGATINYSDSSPKTLFTLKSGNVVLDCWANVTTAFDGTAPSVTIGDGTTADGYMTITDVKTAGIQNTKENEKGSYLWDGTNKKIQPLTADTDVTATITPDSSSAGQVKVYFLIADARYI